jgi:glycosyltransferase involved in cell wall biosynthesis
MATRRIQHFLNGQFKLKSMNILWSIHLYVPTHNCGSEYYAHNINKYMVSRGHNVRVVLHQARMHNVKTPYTFEGVDVYEPNGSIDQFSWADVILTHLDFTHHTINIAEIIKRPCINVIHNSHPYESVRNARSNNYCIYNSRWIKNKLNYQWPSMVFTPPVDYRKYDLGKDPRSNEYITLINLDENKGGFILKRLAKAMPNKKFLAVKGSYSEPFYFGQASDFPPNVTVVPNTPNILEIYSQTRILLMLSRYESWGMTATEAMCNGIPVVCTPTAGLKENCAGAGIYLPERQDPVRDERGMIIKDDRDTYDISYLVKQITKLDNEKKYYKVISDECRRRSRELDPMKGLAEVEAFIQNAAISSRQLNTARRPHMI